MAPPTVLLVQAREPGDHMAAHELSCVQRRIGDRPVTLQVANALRSELSAATLDGVDAFIIGGSGNFSVHHPLSGRWVTPLRRMLERALHDAMPGFGICFGHQLLGYHLGAQVITAQAYAEMGTVPIRLTEDGSGDGLFGPLGERFHAHTGHTDCVTDIPHGVQLMAANEQLETQAFRVRGALFYTTQFHPDMTGAEAVARYEAFRSGLPDPTVHEHGSQEFQAANHDATAALIGGFLDLAVSETRLRPVGGCASRTPPWG